MTPGTDYLFHPSISDVSCWWSWEQNAISEGIMQPQLQYDAIDFICAFPLQYPMYMMPMRSIVRTLKFRKANLQLFNELVSRIPWETALKYKGAEQS